MAAFTSMPAECNSLLSRFSVLTCPLIFCLHYIHIFAASVSSGSVSLFCSMLSIEIESSLLRVGMACKK